MMLYCKLSNTKTSLYTLKSSRHSLLSFDYIIILILKVIFRNNSGLIIQKKSKLELDNTFEQKENIVPDLDQCLNYLPARRVFPLFYF